MRALLSTLQVVVGDPFNSDPNDPEVMSEDVRNRLAAGENLPVRSRRPPFPKLRC